MIVFEASRRSPTGGLHIKMLHKKFALFSLSLTLFEATFSLSPRQLFSLSPTLFEVTFFIVWYMFNNIISITLYCYLINITFLIFSFPQKLSKSNWKVFYDENFQLHLMNLIRSGTASAACKWRDPKWRIIDIWWCAACRDVPWFAARLYLYLWYLCRVCMCRKYCGAQILETCKYQYWHSENTNSAN